MKKRQIKKLNKSDQKKSKSITHRYCTCKPPLYREFEANVTPQRERFILQTEKKWANGTVLHYYFYTSPRSWSTSNAERDIVRQAFQEWNKLGIGLDFQEVTEAGEAEIRVGFLRGDGAWSYVGRDVLAFGSAERTMNFGWSLLRDGEIDTAIHEIGHTLGLSHEHQNPKAGIEWDEEAVYTALAQPPNNWDRDTTFFNIIRKLDPDTIQGSTWDPNSIMHYPFGPGLILKPTKYTSGLTPLPGLSKKDISWAKQVYPSQKAKDFKQLEPLKAIRLRLEAGDQQSFVILPEVSRYYSISTFGESDCVLVLFERVNGELRYVTADDDSGSNFNALINFRLYSDREYIVAVRLYYRHSSADLGLMMW